MILLDYVVKVFDLQDFRQPEPPVQNQQPIHVVQYGEMCSAFIHHKSVGEDVVTYCTGEEGGGHCSIPMLTEHEIKGLSKPVDRPVIVHPLAFDPDTSFIHPPGNSGGALLGLGLCGD